ncbi:hypothetical protein BCR42DRAFT_419780 [Absidia repens]|uniref:Uncharacterized protein n=1 Tax=Absidia repens TaxID=90262 RepID=A0A1X2IA87_9FUNG|nr:hypothetical protein BCR42DRAFT_419780 [Absidia repens]
MDPNKSVVPDELNTNGMTSTEKSAISSATSGKSKTPKMALGDLVDDQVHSFVIRLDKTTIDPKIEKMYGPFEDTPLWAYPPLAASPKPPHPANNTQQVTNSQTDLTSEIMRLKALIAERQRNNTKQRLEQKPLPQQQASSVLKPAELPSTSVLSSSSTAPPAPGTSVDVVMSTSLGQADMDVQPESEPNVQQSQTPVVSASSTSLPQPSASAVAASTTPTLSSTIDTNTIQEDSVFISTAMQDGDDLVRANSDGQNLLPGAETAIENSQHAERMETVQANGPTLDGAADERANNDFMHSDREHTTRRLSGQTRTDKVNLVDGSSVDHPMDMTHNDDSDSGGRNNISSSNSNNNNNNELNRGIYLSDSDSDLNADEEDNERALLKSEEEKHKSHLAEIRQLQAEANDELGGLDFERKQFEKYIRRLTTLEQQRRRASQVQQSQRTSNSPAGRRETAVMGLVLGHSGEHRKTPATEHLSSSQKRQKTSDNRSIPPQNLGYNRPPPQQRSFGNIHPTNMATSQSSAPGAPRTNALNKKPSTSIGLPSRAALYNKSTDNHQKNEIKPLPGGMDVADYFKEFSDLVRNRAIIDLELERLSTLANSDTSISNHRQAPRTEKLITLDDTTFSCAPFRLINNANKQVSENHKPLRYSESLLLAMMIDGIPNIPTIPPPIRQSLRDILAQAPADFKTSLSHYKNGQVLPGLDSMLNANWTAIKNHGNLELLWVTYTELMVYRYGYSDELASAVLNAQQHHPFCLDIYWQTIFAAQFYTSRSALITEILKSISASRSSPNFNGEPTSVSEKSTEVLLRTLKYNGISGIIDQLLPTANVNLSDAGRLLSISLKRTPSYIYITDHDLCYLWMSVVVYYVYGQLQQDTNRRHWFDRITETGELAPSTNALFLIDWSEIRTHLLSSEEQTVVVTILLEMLSYFCEKAQSNGAKKPLLIAVWRNLVGCLEILKCYGAPGTLMLLKRNMQATWKIKALQPEMADMTFVLEKKISKNHQQVDIDPLVNKVLKSAGAPMKQLPTELFLAYRSAIGLEPKSSNGNRNLLVTAWRLGRPLWQIYNYATLSKLDNMKAIVMNRTAGVSPDLALVQINYLCGLYSSALGVADSFEMLQAQKFKINEFRKMPLAWVNALMVHLIHFWLTLDPFLLQSFLKEVSSPGVLNSITVDDGRFLFLRFKKDCEKLAKN